MAGQSSWWGLKALNISSCRANLEPQSPLQTLGYTDAYLMRLLTGETVLLYKVGNLENKEARHCEQCNLSLSHSVCRSVVLQGSKYRDPWNYCSGMVPYSVELGGRKLGSDSVTR